ncbi:MAG: DNA mismatch repair protein MutS, partial [Desulfovibrio sp.]|nr:DNA mismatch repair protein MutS [Desulfovibrio sp.]
MLDDAKLTPMFEQYKNIKADYQDALLFYRMGDFYELFFEDAITASRELQITLTSRCKGANAVPMAGVPWHSADTYISQLIAKGYVIAICEQTDDAKPGKGLMERSVTRIITPGTIVDDINLESNHNNYLGCILQNEEQNLFTFVWAEISTSKWTGAEFNKLDEVWQWVKKMQPRELLLPKDLNLPERSLLPYMHVVHIQNIPNIPRAQEILCQAQHVPTVTVLGLDKKPLLTQTCAALLTYVEQTQKTPIDQMAPFSPLNLSRHMIIDEVTERHLEIFSCLNGQKGKGTLRAVVDKTVTGMGGRLLEQMLHHPLKEEESILYIQSCVAFFFANDTLRSSLRKLLSNIADMERITQRIGLNRCSPKDFIQLRSSLTHLPKLKTLLAKANALNPTQGISQILDNFDSLEECSQHL